MIEKLNLKNFTQCAGLAHLLWPESDYEELVEEFRKMISSIICICFLYFEGTEPQEYLGFVQVSLRNDYVEGCSTSPVAYIEGIYIADGHRRKGIAKRLIETAESWGKEKGCIEIASDCELENKLSIDFHSGIGFEEANRVVCFFKKIE